MRYRLLGPVSVVGAPALAGPKQASVLAALLLSANRVVPEDRLIDLTWGEAAPKSARGRLQVLVSGLRKVVGADVITHRSGGYVAEVGAMERDLDVFEHEVRQATTPHDLRGALARWTGQPLGGVSDALAARERPALEERRLVVLEDLAELELAAGRHAEVLAELRGLVGEHPLRERLRACLMLALQRCGRSAEALDVYAQAHDVLVEELGIEPGRDLQEVRLRVLRGQGRASSPAELPMDVRGFAGRDSELQALDEDDDGVWVITGTAGVGKTALAVRWAHGARERYPDGQLYVDLRGFDADDEPLTSSGALAQLLRALGADLREDDQGRSLRTLLADRDVLLVLDNARDAAQVLPLLPSSGRVLVTSRHRLGELVARTGARVLDLAPLPPADSHAVLASVLGARRVAAEPEAVRELARLCGHHPLALRVAAANVTTTIAQLVAELRRSPLAGLTVDGGEESVLAAAFSLSYQALADVERRAFRLLSLVPGPDFTVAAVAELLDVPGAEASRLLRRLVAVNLVEPHAPGRFRFHDLVREYAEDRLRADEPEGDRAWHRLLAWYLAAADAAVALFDARIVTLPRTTPVPVPREPVAFADRAEATAWLDVETPVLTAALRRAATQGPYPAAWYLADALRRFFHDHGRRDEWLDLAPVVLRAAEERGDHAAEALVQLSLGGACFREGRYEDGVRHSTRAVRAARTCGWRECEATAVANLGSMFEWTGRLTEAVAHSTRARDLFRELGNRTGETLALNSLSCHHRQLGELAEAERHLDEAIALCRADGLRFWEAANLADLAVVQHWTGRVEEAGRTACAALESFRALGSRFGEATALTALSGVRLASDERRAAVRLAQQAVECARQDGDRQALATALTALGRAAGSAADLREALEITEEAGLRALRIEAGAALALVLAGTDEARAIAGEALTLAREGGFRLYEAEALFSTAVVLSAAAEHTRAEKAARVASGIWQAAGHRIGVGRAARFLTASASLAASGG